MHLAGVVPVSIILVIVLFPALPTPMTAMWKSPFCLIAWASAEYCEYFSEFSVGRILANFNPPPQFVAYEVTDSNPDGFGSVWVEPFINELI
jgi:hypothetical protein